MDLTAEQLTEFDSLFKSFIETFRREFNKIRSTQNKIHEQVKSNEVINDEFFQESCARISEPESPDLPSNTSPISENDNDKEESVSHTGDESDIMSQSIRDGTKQSFDDGKSFLSPFLSPGIQYEAVSENNTSPPYLVSSPPLGDTEMHPSNVLSPPMLRHGPDRRSDPLINTGADSEAFKAETIAPSFHRHGPDQGNTCFVGIEQDSFDLLTSVRLAFPKHGPDILTFFRQFTSDVITQPLLSSQSVGCTAVVRMAEGRETAYGRLRPVRRPWF